MVTRNAMVTDKKDGECQLHNVNFYNLLPRAIVCMAVGKSVRKLALARDDGTIEVWNLSHAPFLEKTIPGGEGVSIEGLAWSGGRLFSVSLAGTLIEWDLSKIPCVKQSILLTGNAAWCIDVSKDERLLAIGTEGGYINLYRLDNDEVTYERIMDKQEGRIVCCNFDYTGNFLVTGSTDAVRVWDVRNGHAVHKMTTGRAHNKQQTTVWAVLVLKDFTILSADSRGKLVVYDGHMGTVLEQHNVSTADLLCLTLNEQHNIVFVGGVEPIIRVFQRAAEGSGNRQFIRTHNRRGHTHDIKTMATHGRYLFSGGIDGLLLESTSPPLMLNRHYPQLPGPATMVAAATDSRLVLLKYVNYLEVWTLAPANAPSQQGGNKVLQIRSKNDEQIVAAAIAPNGRWIVYSTESNVRLLRYDYNRKDPINSRLVRVRNTPEHFTVCYRVDFTPDSNGLFLYDRNGGTINFFSCATADDNQEWDHKQSIDAGRWLSEMVTLSAVSQCSRYLVCADLGSSIVVFERSAAKWKRSISLPRYKLPPIALAIQPGKTRVAVTFSDHKLFVYDFDQFSFVFSTYLQLPKEAEPSHPVGGITFDPRHESALILQNGSKILSLRFGADIEEEMLQLAEQNRSKRWRPRLSNQDTSANGEGSFTKYKLRVVRDAPRLVSIAWMGESELVAIQANALSMVEHLPAAFRKKAYGKA